MATKGAYDHSIGEALRAQLDAISLRVGVDPSIVLQMLPYPEPWEPPYEEDNKEDDDEDDDE